MTVPASALTEQLRSPEPHWLVDNTRRLWRRGLDTVEIAKILNVDESRAYRALSQAQDARDRQKRGHA